MGVTKLYIPSGDGPNGSHFCYYHALLRYGPKPEPKPGQNVPKTCKIPKDQNWQDNHSPLHSSPVARGHIFSRMKGMRSEQRARVTRRFQSVNSERTCPIPLENRGGQTNSPPCFPRSLFALNKMSFAHFVLGGRDRRLRNWGQRSSLCLC